MRLPVLVTGMVLAISGLTGGISGWSVHQFQDDAAPIAAVAGGSDQPGEAGTAATEIGPIDERCAQELACAFTHYQRLVRIAGVKDAVANLANDTKNHEKIHQYCHDVLHVVGEAALDLYWPDFPAAFSAGPAACGDGYHHGVINQAVLRMGRGPELLAQLPQACKDLEAVYFLTWECYHGVGHAFYVYFKGDMRETYRACMEFKEGHGACVNGVTMAEQDHNEKDTWSRENPFMHCEANKDLLQEFTWSCYTMSGVVVAKTYGGEGGMRWCNQVQDPLAQRGCWDGVPRLINKGSATPGEQAEPFCLIADTEEGQEICAKAVAEQNAAYFASAERALSYCDGYTVARLKKQCVEYLENNTGAYDADTSNAGISGQFGE